MHSIVKPANRVPSIFVGVVIAVSLTAFGSMLLRHASQTRLAVEAQMAMEIDGENRTVCRKFGMGPESVSHVECIHELTEIRKRHEQRIASEAIGAL